MSTAPTTKIQRQDLLPLKNITELVNVPKLTLSKNFLAQISFYHHKIKGFEWSGPLIYSREGADDVLNLFKDGKNETMELTVNSVLLADIGSPGYTSYVLDDPEINMEIMNAQLEGQILGHCHTHHNMKAYFSGTDNEELQENTPNHKMYLSLIVNYNDGGEYTARLCCKASERLPIKAFIKDLLFFNKKNQLLDFTDIYTKADVIYYIDIPISYELDSPSIERYEKLRKAKEVPVTNFGVGQSWSRHAGIGRQLAFNDVFGLDDDDTTHTGLEMLPGKLYCYLKRVILGEIDATYTYSSIYEVRALLTDIEKKYTKKQLQDVEQNIENLSEEVIKSVWKVPATTDLEDDEIFEVVEEAYNILTGTFPEFKKINEIFSDYYDYCLALVAEDENEDLIVIDDMVNNERPFID